MAYEAQRVERLDQPFVVALGRPRGALIAATSSWWAVSTSPSLFKSRRCWRPAEPLARRDLGVGLAERRRRVAMPLRARRSRRRRRPRMARRRLASEPSGLEIGSAHERGDRPDGVAASQPAVRRLLDESGDLLVRLGRRLGEMPGPSLGIGAERMGERAVRSVTLGGARQLDHGRPHERMPEDEAAAVSVERDEVRRRPRRRAMRSGSSLTARRVLTSPVPRDRHRAHWPRCCVERRDAGSEEGMQPPRERHDRRQRLGAPALRAGERTRELSTSASGFPPASRTRRSTTAGTSPRPCGRRSSAASASSSGPSASSGMPARSKKLSSCGLVVTISAARLSAEMVRDEAQDERARAGRAT